MPDDWEPVDLKDYGHCLSTDWLDMLLTVVPTPLLIYWLIGYDGGTIFSLTQTHPSGSMPDPWTMTAKADLQLIYEYAVLKKGTTVDQFAAARDPESHSLPDEIIRSNLPRLNRRQSGITRPPKVKPSMDAPAALPVGGGRRSAAALADLRQGRDPQARQEAGAMFTETISDDEDDDPGGAAAELEDIEYEIEEFNTMEFKPAHFLPPPGLTRESIFEMDIPIRVPVKYERDRIPDGILGENDGELLDILSGCSLHVKMRVPEWVGNRTQQRAKAEFKAGHHVAPCTRWNKFCLTELCVRAGWTIRSTVDGTPRCTTNGNCADKVIANWLLLRGFDCQQPGIRNGSIEYPSSFVQELAELNRGLDPNWVANSLPDLAEALLDLAEALTLASSSSYDPEAAIKFEKFARRAVHGLCELYNHKASWYMWQLLGPFVEWFKKYKILGMLTNQTMEAVQQTVRSSVKHSNNGAAVGPMSAEVRKDPTKKPAFMEKRRETVKPREENLWRRLAFRALAVTKSLRQRDPELSYGAALAMVSRLKQLQRVVEHPVFQQEFSTTICFVKYVARWLRLWRMGAHGSRAKFSFAQPRCKPLLKTREVYETTLNACTKLIDPEW